MRTHLAIFAALTSVATVSVAYADDELPSIAVMDVKAGGGVSAEAANFVSSTIARTATETEAFKVLSGEDIRALLSLEAQKQMCGAESDSCLAELGGALGADYLISGSLKKIGDATSLELSLLNVREAKGVNRVGKKIEGESSLFDVVPAATVELLAKALEGRQGDLVVSVSEAGATVKLDGRIVGVTPLGAQKVTAGLHLLEVEKKGFITQQEQVKVKADQTTARSVGMVPSPDFLEEYQASADRMRLGAWISTGVLVAGAGAGVFFNGNAQRIHTTFTADKEKFQAGDPTAPSFSELEATRAQGLNAQNLAYISFGVAGAAAISAVYFFIAGDDPGRYSRFQASIIPTDDGVGVVGILNF